MEGNARARTALELVENPGEFLSTVQIGITLVGILASAFGGARIAESLAMAMRSLPGIGPYNEAISLDLVVLGIAYLSLIVGELVPKQLALTNPERIAAALAADGYHARVDGWTSLAVLVGAVGVWLGYPLADPLVGLLITVAILWLVWQSGLMVFTRALDGVNPEVIHALRHAATHVPGVQALTDVRARWVGHYLQAEGSIAVAPELSVAEGHAIAMEVRHQLLHHVRYLNEVTVHVDPLDKAGSEHHRIAAHIHDGLATHSHA